MIETYKPSGRFSPMFFVYLIGAGAVIIGLTWLYVRVLHWVPLIFINAVVAAFFAGFCAMALNLAAKAGNCRNLVLATLIGLLCGGGTVAAKHWFQYQHRIDLTHKALEEKRGKKIPKEVMELTKVLYPFKTYIKDRVQTGWSVGKAGRSTRAPAKGWLVWMVWAIEAGMIVLLAITGIRMMAESPFSESSGKWADEESLLLAYNIPEHVPVYEDVETLDDILDFPEATEHSPRSLIYKLNSVPGEDEEDSFLSVVNRHVSFDKEGKKNKSDSTILKDIPISAAQRSELLDRVDALLEELG